jgi:hypothetical protein
LFCLTQFVDHAGRTTEIASIHSLGLWKKAVLAGVDFRYGHSSSTQVDRQARLITQGVSQPSIPLMNLRAMVHCEIRRLSDTDAKHI